MKTKFRPDPIIKEDHALIPVRNGDEWLWAKIDIEDLERVKKHKWFYHRDGDGRGNIQTKIDGKTKSLHGFILKFDRLIDHEDCDNLNNRKLNLRKCSPTENSTNRKRRRDANCSYKGINFEIRTSKYRVRIGINGERINIGRYDSEEEAAKAYDIAARGLHGKFGRYNFPKAGEQSAII